MSGIQAEKALRGAEGNYSHRSKVLKKKPWAVGQREGEESGKGTLP